MTHLRKIFSALACLTSSVLADVRPNVLAHGTERVSDDVSPVWAAVITESQGQSKSLVLYRERFSESRWLRLPEVPARLLGLTSHNLEGVVMLEQGTVRGPTWAWFSPSRYATGPFLPQNARLIALAGDRRSLWALGRADAELPRPTTASTAATTPTTRPAGLALFELMAGQWTERGERLPGAAPPNISLAIIDAQPHLAAWRGTQPVELRSFDPATGQWTQPRLIETDGRAPERVKLLSLAGRPAIWLAGTGAGSLFVRDRLVQLGFEGTPPTLADTDLAVTGDQLRLIFRRETSAGQSALWEQRYNEDGTMAGKPQPLIATNPAGMSYIDWWSMAAMALVTIIIVSSILRRRSTSASPKRDDDDT